MSMKRATSRFFTLSLLVAAAGCTTAWGVAREKDTAAAYQEYIYNNPKSSNLREARRLEATAALRELGPSPTDKQLREYLATYPKTPVKEQALETLDRVHLEEYVANADIPRLTTLEKKTKFENIKKRATEALGYFSAARTALLTAKPAFFDKYIRENSEGAFVEEAKRSLQWMMKAIPKRQATVFVVFDGKLPKSLKSRLAKSFEQIGAKAEAVSDLSKVKAAPGEVVYRVVHFPSGEKKPLFTEDGKTRSVHPGGGAAAEILVFTGSGYRSIWSWQAKEHVDLPGIELPIINWNTAKTVLAVQKYDNVIGDIEPVGRFLLLATSKGFDLFNTNLPDRPHRFTAYVRPPDPSGVEDTNQRLRVATSGSIVATYGDGIQLVDCSKLSALKTKISDFTQVGQISSASFVGRHFFFATKTGLYSHHINWPGPRAVTKDETMHLTTDGQRLLSAGGGGITIFETDGNGMISSTKFLDGEDFPDGFPPGADILTSWADPPSTLLINTNGDVARLRKGKLKVMPDLRKSAGLIRAISGRGKWLATLGDRGLSLFRQKKKSWELVGSVPIEREQCHDVHLEYPIAYVACKKKLVSAHVGLLTMRPKMPKQ